MHISITETLIKDVLEKTLGEQVEFAYLLGSAGKERFNSESDIDLAVYWKVIPSFSLQSQVTESLTASWCREVDLVSLNTADLIFTRQVLETGRLLFCNSPGIHLQWKSSQLSKYPDFKYSRAVIEKNILNRKKYV